MVGLKLVLVKHMIHLELDKLIIVFSQNLHESLMILGPLSFAGDACHYLIWDKVCCFWFLRIAALCNDTVVNILLLNETELLGSLVGRRDVWSD